MGVKLKEGRLGGGEVRRTRECGAQEKNQSVTPLGVCMLPAARRLTRH